MFPCSIVITIAANFLRSQERRVLLALLDERLSAEAWRVVTNRGPIKSKFPGAGMRDISDRYIHPRRKSGVVVFSGAGGGWGGRRGGGDPYSGCHGDRVETVSRGREPSAIRDPAKWTVPSTYGYCKVKLVYTHPILPEAPFKPLSTIHDYRLNVRLKKRFRRGH